MNEKENIVIILIFLYEIDILNLRNRIKMFTARHVWYHMMNLFFNTTRERETTQQSEREQVMVMIMMDNCVFKTV